MSVRLAVVTSRSRSTDRTGCRTRSPPCVSQLRVCGLGELSLPHLKNSLHAIDSLHSKNSLHAIDSLHSKNSHHSKNSLHSKNSPPTHHADDSPSHRSTRAPPPPPSPDPEACCTNRLTSDTNPARRDGWISGRIPPFQDSSGFRSVARAGSSNSPRILE